MKPYVVGAVFARGGSKGIPRKNVRLLGGKPLIAYAIETARAVPLIGRVIVSTEDAEIAEIARTYGAEVPFLRPAHLAEDTTPEWLAWQHALQTLAAQPGARPIDLFVTLPPTSPFRAVDDVSQCIERLLTTDADIVVTMKPAARNPYFNMVRCAENGDVQLAVQGDRRYDRRQDAPTLFDLTTVAYAARPEFILRATSIFDGRVKAVLVPSERALDIDDELEWQFAEFLIACQRSGAA